MKIKDQFDIKIKCLKCKSKNIELCADHECFEIFCLDCKNKSFESFITFQNK